MKFALDKDGKRVHINNTFVREEYFCPTCNEELILKKGEIKAHHFSHKANGCSDGWNYDMSEWHMNWQEEYDEESREVVFNYKGEIHRVDVFVNNTVIEFQHSPLSCEEFEERNNFYNALGYNVIWLFDLIEQYREKRIKCTEKNEDVYKWSRPKSTFNEYFQVDPKVRLYFQVDDDEDDESLNIMRIDWVGSNGFERFASNEWFTNQEFVELTKGIERELEPVEESKPRLVDCLVKYRTNRDNIVHYKCFKNNYGYECFENCYCCEFNVNGLECNYRFKDESIENIIDVKRDKEGKIVEVEYEDNGKVLKKEFPRCEYISKTMHEIDKEYQAKVYILRNVVTNKRVQVNSIIPSMEKYKKVYGKVEMNDSFGNKSYEIYGFNNPDWVVDWYKK